MFKVKSGLLGLSANDNNSVYNVTWVYNNFDF